MVSLDLPVTDGNRSLRTTVKVLQAENRREISEIPIVACSRTTPAALAVAEALGREHAAPIGLHHHDAGHTGKGN